MHNCKSTRNSLVELALDDVSLAESARLLAELKDCRECQEEFGTIKSTLRMSGQALQAALPAEEFWHGYHARLQTVLSEVNVSGVATERAGCPRSQGFWQTLRSVLTTSVRVPAPVAAALVLVFAASVFFAVYPRGATQQSLTPTSTASAATKVVEVPVIKEKVVTRVVYVETNRRPRSAVNDLNQGRSDSEGGDSEGGAAQSPLIDARNGLARVRPDSPGAAMSLAGFKPTDEVKLTIIKGSDPK
jgi:negative regulator of sigma E activity